MIDWRRLLHDEARIAAVAPVEALNALGSMLPDIASREHALAVAAAVMMIEPTLANPRSEIIELLINTLGVEPGRVIDLARRLTHPAEQRPPAEAAATANPPAPRVARPRSAAGAARTPRTPGTSGTPSTPSTARKSSKRPAAAPHSPRALRS